LQIDTQALTQEVSRTDDTGLQDQLQQQLALRGERELALKQAREELEEAEQTLRATEQERLVSEQKLAPARERINELRLKEQEARLAEESYASQLAEAQADEAELLPLLEEGVRASRLQGEINRLNEDMAALGAVNLAALDELSTARERKTYLDAQSQDLANAGKPGDRNSQDRPRDP
jgi:chromosome segregation protein